MEQLYNAKVIQTYRTTAVVHIEVDDEPMVRIIPFDIIDRAGLSEKECEQLRREGPAAGMEALILLDKNYEPKRAFF